MGENITEEQRVLKNERERDRYHRNGRISVRRAQIMQSNEKARRRNVELQRHIKGERGCVDCGEHDPVVLQFHHRDPSQKKFNVAQPGTSSEERLLAEIEKCDVLCANCHLRHHAREKASARCA